MGEEIRTSSRELIARVATLELLVADLVDVLWRVAPEQMDQMAREAAQDLTIQNSRTMPGAEHQRERLFAVLQDRRRKLQHRRQSAA